MFRVPPAPRPFSTARPARQAGFTLIELLTVMVVIIILLSITISVQRGIVNKQNITKAQGEIEGIKTALDAFKAQYGDYPPSTDNVDSTPEDILIKALTGRARWEHVSAGVGKGSIATFPGAKSIPMPTSTSDTTLPPYKVFLDTAKFTIGTVNDGQHSTTPVLLDPWGNAYLYRYKQLSDATTVQTGGGTTQAPHKWLGLEYLVVSRGPDGLPYSYNDVFQEQMDTTGVVPPDYFTTVSGQNADNITSWVTQ